VRELVAPDAPAPRYTGQLSVGGVALRTELPQTPGAYHMVFGRRAFLGFSVLPGGEAWWFANVAQPQLPSREELAAITPAAWKERLLALFAEDAGPARALISGTGDAPVAYPIFDMPPVPRWSRGAMALMGDAAHATSPSAGQGAAMAIEDAVVLGQCLRDVPDTAQALRTYEGLRRERVEKVVRYSARVGSAKVPGPVGRAFRDLLMPLALKIYDGSSAQAWLYAHHLEWEARVTAA
jgi:2-polyprenyl-6-methoxyphenol hydroxylase-like FAD-dependent oxidoreductase